MAREVLAFTTAIELESYDLLGFSIGSFVAQRVALARPNAIGKVVLASTAPQGARGMGCPRAQALPSLEAGENQPVQRTRPRLPV